MKGRSRTAGILNAMDTTGRIRITQSRDGASRGAVRSHPWLGGGPDGNEQLTATLGVMLLIILPVLGVTIVRIGQLIWLHLFVGLLLIGPVALKMASTGYRFVTYYAGNLIYRHKGPPELVLRLLGPVLVVSTVIVFLTGVLLLFEGPSHRGLLLLIHKVSFILWLAVTALHVLGHLPRLGKSLRTARANAGQEGISPGAAGRNLALLGALIGGVVLAIVLIPDFSAWTAAGAIPHHHHHGG
jgi:hypothetical protein